MSSIQQFLPPSLILGPHLSAARYFLVCSLTVAAWDTFVLSPRSWRLQKSQGWPPLKIIYLMLRYLMPIEFIAVAIAYLDDGFSENSCRRFYLFEPIMTAILMTLSSFALVIRVSAIYNHSLRVKLPLLGLLLAQIGVHFACCFFYRIVPLKPTQGCVPGPKHNWVGIYWLFPTLLYIATFSLALNRSIISLRIKHVSWWKLTNRDGLNLYAAILGINLVNVLYFFLIEAQDDADPIKTIVTSMAAVLTVTMTMRVILNVRGSLYEGGTFDGHLSSRGTTAHSNSGLSAQHQLHSYRPDLTSKQSGNAIVDFTRSTPPTYAIETARRTQSPHSSDVKDTSTDGGKLWFESPTTLEKVRNSSLEGEPPHGRQSQLQGDLASYNPYPYLSNAAVPPVQPPSAATLPRGNHQSPPTRRTSVRPLPRPVPTVSMDPAARRRKEVWDVDSS